MQWYDGTNQDGRTAVHADEAWWQDSISTAIVVSRDAISSMV